MREQSEPQAVGSIVAVAPEVSFLVAARNVGPFVGPAVRSALQQIGVSVEVIVVDDGSTDDTAQVVSALAQSDDRVVLIRRSEAGGPSAARNDALARARGTWIAVLDADDLIVPERSRRLMDLAAATSADVVADNFERLQEDGRPTGSTLFPDTGHPYSFKVDVAAFLRGNTMFDRRATFGYLKPMFRRDVVCANGIVYRDDIHIGEDYHFCMECLLAHARFFVTSESFYKYRVRQGSLSWRISEQRIERLRQEHRRLRLGSSPDREIAAAAGNYDCALERAALVARIIAAAKAGRATDAMVTAVLRPSLWPIIARFGWGALRRRLGD